MPEPKRPSANSTTICVELAERKYPIVIGTGTSARIASMLREQLPATKHAVVITDANVCNLASSIASSLNEAGCRTSELTVPSGEPSKSTGEIERLWCEMLAEHTDRGSVVVAVGGGVVGDLAGFAAATFARGIPLVQVPTTLLSQVDSSVGGKTGINLPGAKNLVGSFWQPSLVVIDIESMATLPRREYVSGLAEVLKYGVIMRPTLFEYLEEHAAEILAQQPAELTHIIAESCRCKAEVVAEDERETTGRRAILNYGHTFAHAIENTAGYGSLLHGEAVSIGMHMAATLAAKMGMTSPELIERQRALILQLELPCSYSEADAEAMWLVMQHDKKVQHGQLRFVLPTELGHVELVPSPGKELVCQTLQECRS